MAKGDDDSVANSRSPHRHFSRMKLLGSVANHSADYWHCGLWSRATESIKPQNSPFYRAQEKNADTNCPVDAGGNTFIIVTLFHFPAFD